MACTEDVERERWLIPVMHGITLLIQAAFCFSRSFHREEVAKVAFTYHLLVYPSLAALVDEDHASFLSRFIGFGGLIAMWVFTHGWGCFPGGHRPLIRGSLGALMLRSSCHVVGYLFGPKQWLSTAIYHCALLLQFPALLVELIWVLAIPDPELEKRYAPECRKLGAISAGMVAMQAVLQALGGGFWLIAWLPAVPFLLVASSLLTGLKELRMQQCPSVAALALLVCGLLCVTMLASCIPPAWMDDTSITLTGGCLPLPALVETVAVIVCGSMILAIEVEKSHLQDWRSLANSSWACRQRGTVLGAVLQHGLALQYADKELRGDMTIVMAAVSKAGAALEYASTELCNNRTVVRAAVTRNGISLKFAGREPRHNREIVSVAVRNCGRALVFAADELRKDREIVMAAVSQDWSALEFAADNLRGDRAVVLAAVGQDGMALRHATEEMQGDAEVVWAVLRGHTGGVGSRNPLQFISHKLLEVDDAVLQAVLQHVDSRVVRMTLLSGNSCTMVVDVHAVVQTGVLRCLTACGLRPHSSSKATLLDGSTKITLWRQLKQGQVNELSLVLG